MSKNDNVLIWLFIPLVVLSLILFTGGYLRFDNEVVTPIQIVNDTNATYDVTLTVNTFDLVTTPNGDGILTKRDFRTHYLGNWSIAPGQNVTLTYEPGNSSRFLFELIINYRTFYYTIAYDLSDQDILEYSISEETSKLLPHLKKHDAKGLIFVIQPPEDLLWRGGL